MPDVLHQSSAGLVCVSSVAAERLKDGTDLVGTRTSLRRLSYADRTLTIDSMDVQPSDVRDLGVLLDSELTLNLT